MPYPIEWSPSMFVLLATIDIYQQYNLPILLVVQEKGVRSGHGFFWV